MAMVVEERRRLREEEAQLAAEAENVLARNKSCEELLRQQREALQKRAKVVADKEAHAATLIKSRVPLYWKHNGEGVHLEHNPFIKTVVQEWIREAVLFPHSHQCPLTPASSLLNATVTRVLRVENGPLWSMYEVKKAMLKKEYADSGMTVPSLSRKAKQPWLPSVELSADVNELLLFHGTSEATAMTIASHGFDERVAHLGGLYGAGSYFSDNSCKSHQYSRKGVPTARGEHVLLVCRVTMGWPLFTTTSHRNERRPPQNPSIQSGMRPFDSIFANFGSKHHNEFVVYDRSQAYPEYVVYYKINDNPATVNATVQSAVARPVG